MAIRPIGPGDIGSWCRLRQALWPDAVEGELLQEATAYFDGASDLEAVFLAEAPSGEPLGMLEVSLRPFADGCRTTPVPYIEGWYVVPEARRRGVGRDLMAAATSWARARGYPEIASDTVLGNLAGERAHLALGFEEVERAIRFRKDL